MISSSFFSFLSLFSLCLMHNAVGAQMLGSWSPNHGGFERRQNGDNNRNGQNNGPDNSAFTIVNGRIFTPGLGIILAVGGSVKTRDAPANKNTSPSHLRLWAATSFTSRSMSQAMANSKCRHAISRTRSPRSLTLRSSLHLRLRRRTSLYRT